MRKYIAIGLVSILSLTAVTSCIKSDIDLSKCLYHIRIKLVWIDTNPVRENDSTHLAILPIASSRIDLNSDHIGREVKLLPGKYDIVGYESAKNVSIDGKYVSVSTNTDGTAMDPGQFSAGEALAEVLAIAEDQVIPLPMRQQTRKLIVKVKVTGAGLPLMSSLDGSLSGIAIERDINNSFPPANGRSRPPAAKKGSISYTLKEDAEQWFVGGRDLIGIDGDSSQDLNLKISFANGETTSLTEDVTGGLTSFYTQDVRQPWYIILEINLDFNLQATITNWYAGPDSWLIAQ